MDLIRILKLKEVNGDFDKLNEKEKFFIYLLKDIELDLLSMSGSNTRFYVTDDSDGECLIYTNKKMKIIRVHHIIITQAVMKEFKMEYVDAHALISNVLHNYLGLTDYKLI